jgi:phenylacetate-CoA ligase
MNIQRNNIIHAKRGEFYGEYFSDIDPDDIKTEADFPRPPFTENNDLRGAYPLGLSAVPEEKSQPLRCFTESKCCCPAV